MDLPAFKATIAAAEPPAGLDLALQTLWWDAKGDWKKAHECAQEEKTPIGSSVHAYLHRVEGDLANAGYWYKRAGKPPATGTTAAEWDDLAMELLGRWSAIRGREMTTRQNPDCQLGLGVATVP